MLLNELEIEQMNKLKISITFLLIIFFNVFAHDIYNNRLTVFGKVKVFADADRDYVVFNIKGVGSNLKFAINDAKNKMQNIMNKFI
jgi:hypothetical protein